MQFEQMIRNQLENASIGSKHYVKISNLSMNHLKTTINSLSEHFLSMTESELDPEETERAIQYFATLYITQGDLQRYGHSHITVRGINNSVKDINNSVKDHKIMKIPLMKLSLEGSEVEMELSDFILFLCAYTALKSKVGLLISIDSLKIDVDSVISDLGCFRYPTLHSTYKVSVNRLSVFYTAEEDLLVRLNQMDISFKTKLGLDQIKIEQYR